MRGTMNVFISYRRDDTRHISYDLYERFVASYGEESVFLDVDGTRRFSVSGTFYGAIGEF
jgi:hypothetical protein